MPDAWSASVRVGHEFRTLLVDDLSRAHIAQYAGAAGDFNLVHVDDPYALCEADRPGVIAHGMLTMGLVGAFVRQLAGNGTVRTFGGRFLAPVSPGDTLRCTATVVELKDGVDGRSMSLALETSSAAATVFSGGATITSAQHNHEPPNDRPSQTPKV